MPAGRGARRQRDIDPDAGLDHLLARIKACRICIETPRGRPLPHAPNPVLRPSTTARIAICSQAPGVRVHASGAPFTDASGDRLRKWLAVTSEEFYDARRIAIVPMGFCFPGHDATGGDLPPRRECAAAWHADLFAHMGQIELILLVGSYAQRWHRPVEARAGMSAMVRNWRASFAAQGRPRYLSLPHPSWRNTSWLRANPWFEADLLPELQREVRARL